MDDIEIGVVFVESEVKELENNLRDIRVLVVMETRAIVSIK